MGNYRIWQVISHRRHFQATLDNVEAPGTDLTIVPMADQEKVIIKLPFFIHDPVVGRIAYPLNAVLWISYIFFCIILLIALVEDTIKGTPELWAEIVFFFTMAIPLLVVFVLIHCINNKLFYEHIILDGSKLIFRKSKLNGYKQEAYDMRGLKYILVIRDVPFGRGRYSLSLVDKASGHHILVEKFMIVFGVRKWNSFVSELSKITNLPVRTTRRLPEPDKLK